MARRSRSSSVTVTSFDPGTDWTLPQARGLVRDGYTVEQAERLTGWPPAMLTASRPGLTSSR